MIWDLRQAYMEATGFIPDRILVHPVMHRRLAALIPDGRFIDLVIDRESGRIVEIFGLQVVVSADAWPGSIMVGRDEIERFCPTYARRDTEWGVEHKFTMAPAFRKR